MYTKIKFQGNDYLLIGDVESGGAIATKEQFENGTVSYAYLCADGKVRRYLKVIGLIEEIEFYEPVEANMTDEGAINTLFGFGWPR